MSIGKNRLLYVLIGSVLAAGLLTSVLVRPQPRLTASESCYGPCSSVTVLSLSKATVNYGNEHAEKFRVTVSSSTAGTGVPTGDVAVESGTKILCSIRLSRGHGSCSPTARALAPGSHKIVAHYSGNTNLNPSTSSKKTLTVLRH